MNLKILCESSWVFVPENLNMAYASRTFSVRIDPCALPVGEHFTWIKAFDSRCIEKGPVFHIPVTVIISHKLSDTVSHNMSCTLYSGKPVREFIQVPSGASCAAVHLKSFESANCCSIVIHAIQIRPQFHCKTGEYHKILRLGPKENFTSVFPVKEKLVLEVVIALWWSSLDSVLVDYTITFRGLLPDSSNTVMHGADGIHRIDIQSSLSYEEMLPSVVFKSHVIPVRPSDHKIRPLKSRDVIPEGRQIYEMLLTYPLNISKASEITPSLSLMSDLLYESEFESQLWMLFDNTKQFISAGDAYPNQYSTKVDKGDYTLKLQIRHEDRTLLEKLSDVIILVAVKLLSSPTIDVYDKHSHAIVNGTKIGSLTLAPGSTVPVFLAPLPTDRIPKGCLPGHYLLGSMNFFKDDTIKRIESFPMKYVISELPKKSQSTKSVEKEKTLEEEFAAEMKQLRINWIAKLNGQISKDLFEETLLKEKDCQWPILLARLQSLDKVNEKVPLCEKRKHQLLEITTISDQISSVINRFDVLASLGAKNDKKDVAANKKLEQQKNCVIEALVAKGKALCDIFNLKFISANGDPNTEKEKSKGKSTKKKLDEKVVSFELTKDDEVTLDIIDDIYAELQKWADMSEPKVSSFTEKHCVTHNHYGRALKLFLKQLEDKKVYDTEQKCIDYFNNLGWKHCATHLQRCLHVRYPSSYRLF